MRANLFLIVAIVAIIAFAIIVGLNAAGHPGDMFAAIPESTPTPAPKVLATPIF